MLKEQSASSSHAPSLRNLVKRAPDPIDSHVGARIRIRRTSLGMSQQHLGTDLGVSFQQVQKYESGSTHVGAGRLFEISKILDVPVGYFFEEIAPVSEQGSSAPSTDSNAISAMQGCATVVRRRETFKLVRAYSKIEDATIRKRIFDLTKSVAKSGRF